MKKHPAKYTDSFIPIFAKLLMGKKSVLDPFAGTGKLALIKDYGFNGVVVCNEIEPEWLLSSGYNIDEKHIGDARNMVWAKDKSFEAICTSPTYGNRMADHHNAKDGSKRITYTHTLGRKLQDGNTGKMHWGKEYKEVHEAVYRECKRVLAPGGLFILNLSNHIKNGKEIDVIGWHVQTLVSFGFNLEETIEIQTPRMGFGSNAKKRVSVEKIIIFTR